MLFDLRSPRRRTAIKIIYATLAVLMGGGLIFFGIGGEVSGGLVDGLGLGGGGSADGGFEDQIEDAEKQLETQPRNQEALLDLVTLNIQAGNQNLDIDESTGQQTVTSESEEFYNDAADAWDRYLRLKPQKPDSTAGLLMANAFFALAQTSDTAADAQTQVANAAEAQQVAVAANPSTGNLNQLSLYLYFSGKFAEGDSAAARAVAKAPAAQRASLRSQLQQIEQQAQAFQKQVEQEAKGAEAGGNPLESGGALGGGGTGLAP